MLLIHKESHRTLKTGVCHYSNMHFGRIIKPLDIDSRVSPAELHTDANCKLWAPPCFYHCSSDLPNRLACTEFETAKANGTTHCVCKTNPRLTVSGKGMMMKLLTIHPTVVFT
jgi:hypothetical protein